MNDHFPTELQALAGLPAQPEDSSAPDDRFQSLWEAAPDATLMVDAAGLIQLVNSQTEKLFGFSRPELIGQSIEMLVPERFRSIHTKYRHNYFHFPQHRPMGVGREFSIQSKSGREIAVEISLSPLKTGDEQMVLCTIRDITERKQALEMIARQSRSLLELSTPVVKLIDGILLLPLIGVVDTLRAQQIMENLLQAIVASEARVALLDITGIPIIDTQVAQHLMKTVAAAKMLGAEVILTGISPEIAQTLVTLGVRLSEIRTLGSLESGIHAAFRLSGKEIVDRV
ncbi:MAG: PAS domain S-box protein [Candidatus Sericytochromatia bacterium]